MPTWLCTGGTRLLTDAGAVRAESLLPGALLLSDGGGTLAVASVGRLSLSAAELRARPALWSIRVAAGVLGEDAVTVLPDQPVALSGLPRIAARWLVDGITLRRDPPEAPLDILAIVVDGVGTPTGGPCLREGAILSLPAEPILRAARARLAPPAGPLRGRLDAVTPTCIEGWADHDTGHPVAIELDIDGQCHPPDAADLPRPDLAAAGIGDGRRGFRFTPDPPLDPRQHHLIRIRRAADVADLPGSPALLDAAAGLDTILAALPDTDRRAALLAAARGMAERL